MPRPLIIAVPSNGQGLNLDGIVATRHHLSQIPLLGGANPARTRSVWIPPCPCTAAEGTREFIRASEWENINAMDPQFPSNFLGTSHVDVAMPQRTQLGSAIAGDKG